MELPLIVNRKYQRQELALNLLALILALVFVLSQLHSISHSAEHVSDLEGHDKTHCEFCLFGKNLDGTALTVLTVLALYHSGLPSTTLIAKDFVPAAQVNSAIRAPPLYH